MYIYMYYLYMSAIFVMFQEPAH